MRLSIPSLIFLIYYAIPAIGQDAKEIVRKAENNAKGETSTALITIQTIRPKWNREMTVKAWTKGNDWVLIQVNTPVKDKGIVFLKRKKEVWNWIPSIERSIKMPPSMMNQSWMGTDFTNDDLVKEASILEDYTHILLGDTLVDNYSCIKIRLIPKPSSSVIWGSIDMCVEKSKYMMLHVDYFDEDGSLVNRMHGSDVKVFGKRSLPARLEMIPSDKKGNKTILIYNSLVFDTPIDDSFFNIQNISGTK